MVQNETLVENLEVKNREYLKLVEETRNHADILENMNESNDNQEEKQESGSTMRDRLHLLTEENHILFQQVTVLRAHHDQFSTECAEKMNEAQGKISSYDKLKADYDVTVHERDELIRANSFLETKLTQNTQLLGSIEEGRRTDGIELKKMREQLALF